ncbi:MAG TPA: DUF1559 domain-containing protein [Isosphaeraceae bacterium]
MGDERPEIPTVRRVGPLEFTARHLMTFIVCCSIGFTLLGLMIQAVRSAREAARASQCICNICQIKIALYNYHDAFGSFPPAYVADGQGRPMHSWRVLILPWMEQKALYDQYNFAEPWDGPNNRGLLTMMPNNFACPSHRLASSGLTSYAAITGPKTAFPGAGTTKLADIVDGPRDTIMLAEVCNLDIPWTAPRDLDTATMSFRIDDPARPGISSKHPSGPVVVAADTTTWRLPRTIEPETLRAMTTIAGGEPIPDELVGLRPGRAVPQAVDPPSTAP